MIKHSPYYLTFLTVFGNFIGYFFYYIPYIELIDYIPVIIVLFLLVLKIFAIGGIIYRMPFPFWLWIFFTIIHALYTIILTSSIEIPILGLYSYITFFIYWYLYLSVYKEQFFVEKYLKFCLIIFSLVGILGIYQHFFDITLFGYAASIHDRYSLDFYQMYSSHRINSIFSSIQILSCFLLLSLTLLLDNFKSVSRKLFLSITTILVISGFLTGSKIFLVGILVFVGYYLMLESNTKKFFNKAFTLIIVIILFIGLVIPSLIIIKENTSIFNNNNIISRTFEPILDFNVFISDEFSNESIRKKIYLSTITNNKSLFLGNGVGTANSISVTDRVALESYILQIVVEVGFLGLIIIAWLMITSYKRKSFLLEQKGTIIVMAFAMMFNQSFVSVVFFPFYFLVVYPLMYNNANQKF